MGLDAGPLLMEQWPDRQFALEGAKCSFCFGQLHVDRRRFKTSPGCALHSARRQVCVLAAERRQVRLYRPPGLNNLTLCGFTSHNLNQVSGHSKK